MGTRLHEHGPTASLLSKLGKSSAKRDEFLSARLAEAGVSLEHFAADTPPAPVPAPTVSAPVERPAVAREKGKQHEHCRRRRKKLTRAQRIAAQEARDHKRDLRRMDELIGSVRARGAPDEVRPRLISAPVWRMVWLCRADQTGKSQRFYLKKERNQAWAGIVFQAALQSGKRSWSSLRARRVCVLGLLQGALAKYGKLPAREGFPARYGGEIRGIPQSTICTALADPYETRARKRIPVRQTLSGTHRRGGTGSDAGYAQELADVCDAFRWYQPKKGDAEDYETVGDYSLNRYELPPIDVERVDHDRARFGLLHYAHLLQQLVSNEWVWGRSPRAIAAAELAACGCGPPG